ncbi:MAG TPA: rhodanese-like domain-containing protein [Gammaproteobacteria bacterium]|nr:rhodanese-like domain-containing protein [Gammaproteobacteria bacterium]
MSRRLLAAVALVLGLGAAATDVAPTAASARLAADIAAERDHITAEELAERIMNGRATRLIDLRSEREFAAFHIPTATHADIETLVAADLPRDTPIVLYSEGAPHAAQAWVLLELRGYDDVTFLREGVYEWIARIHEPQLAADATPAERADFGRRAVMTRWFGGQPHVGVPRAELAAGYWTAGEGPPEAREGASAGAAPRSAASLIAGIRRRGC